MKRLSLLLALYLTITFIFIQPVLAYNLLGCQWSNADPLHYYYDNWVSSNSKLAWQAAASSWNNSSNDISWNFSANYDVYSTEANDSGADWDGISIIDHSGSTINSATTYLNAFFTDNYSSNQRKSVAGHEFGHCLGLDERNAQVLMHPFTDQRYDNYNISTPQQDDLNGIAAMY